jgi:hypothetical protein
LPIDMDKRRLEQRVKATARGCQILVDPSDAVSPPGCFILTPLCRRKCLWAYSLRVDGAAQSGSERARACHAATGPSCRGHRLDAAREVWRPYAPWALSRDDTRAAHGLEHRKLYPPPPAPADHAQETQGGYGHRAARQLTYPREVFLVSLETP